MPSLNIGQQIYLKKILPEIEEIDPVAADWIKRHIIGGPGEKTDSASQGIAWPLMAHALHKLGKLDEFEKAIV